MKLASRDHYATHMAGIDVPDGVALVASHADLTRVRKTHDRIVLMQHGIGQSYGNRNPAYPGGRDNDAVGLFLVPGPHPAERWKSAYPSAAVEIIGSPPVDDLPVRIPDGRTTVAVTFHWLHHAFDHYKDAVVELARDFDVIGHGHPRASRLPRFWAKHGIEHVPDFHDVCRRADVLVFDNTSAGPMFAATGRPVVVLNAPVWKTWHYGLRFHDIADIGVQVDDPRNLTDAVHRALEDWDEDAQKRRRAVDFTFEYRGDTQKRASEAIAWWAA